MAFRGGERSCDEAPNRVAAEAEEKEFLRAPRAEGVLEALAPLGTDSRKPFLEIAPWLIAVFAQPFHILPDGMRSKTYYAIESNRDCDRSLSHRGAFVRLAALTHTPSRWFLESNSGPSFARESVCASGRGSPCRRLLVPISAQGSR